MTSVTPTGPASTSNQVPPTTTSTTATTPPVTLRAANDPSIVLSSTTSQPSWYHPRSLLGHTLGLFGGITNMVSVAGRYVDLTLGVITFLTFGPILAGWRGSEDAVGLWHDDAGLFNRAVGGDGFCANAIGFIGHGFVRAGTRVAGEGHNQKFMAMMERPRLWERWQPTTPPPVHRNRPPHTPPSGGAVTLTRPSQGGGSASSGSSAAHANSPSPQPWEAPFTSPASSSPPSSSSPSASLPVPSSSSSLPSPQTQPEDDPLAYRTNPEDDALDNVLSESPNPPS